LKRLLLAFLYFVLLSSIAHADSGLIEVKSNYSVKETADRLEKILLEKGMTLFAKVNHGQGAESVGLSLRPTELIIFGNPKVGTALMICSQRIAIDLPQKALVWEDEKGVVRLTYNNPRYLSKRHDTTGCEIVIKNVQNALKRFASLATQ